VVASQNVADMLNDDVPQCETHDCVVRRAPYAGRPWINTRLARCTTYVPSCQALLWFKFRMIHVRSLAESAHLSAAKVNALITDTSCPRRRASQSRAPPPDARTRTSHGTCSDKHVGPTWLNRRLASAST
jgi:hypothetical protein